MKIKRSTGRCLILPLVLFALGPSLAAGGDAPSWEVAAPDSGSQSPAAPKQETGAEAKRPWNAVRFRITNHPSFRMGDWLRVDFRVKFQHDFRAFDPEFNGDEGETSNLRKLVVGVEGYIHRNFEYAVEREIRNEVADLFNLRTRETHALWRDVYGNFRYFRRFQIRAGQFKIPLGLDQLHGPTTGEFVFRSLIGTYLAPGRDIGIMAHGKLFDERLQYQAGLFKHDGWRIHQRDYSPSGERTFAARVVIPPFRWVSPPGFLKPLQDLELGAAFTETAVPEGLRSPRGRTWYETHNYFPRINVRGHRLRLGTELNWMSGPFSLKAEVIRIRDERLGQGLRGQDLPNLISRGWYVSTSWVVTGEKKVRNLEPRRDFIFGKGFGAIELAARAEQIRFGSSEHPGLPSRSTRAANIYSQSERVATFGVNWYVNRRVRILFNGVREQIEDLQLAPISGVGTYWSKIVRIQFGL